MTEQHFDPYYKWLAIPPEEQPPNHYRLLGVKLYETDLDVIETAADRQMSHVRRYASGKYSAESQQLLNEISAAKLCLLRPELRAAYEAELKAKEAAARPKAAELPRAKPLRAVPLEAEESTDESVEVLRDLGASAPRLKTRAGAAASSASSSPAAGSYASQADRRGRKKKNQLAVPLALLAVAFAVVVGVVLMNRDSSDDDANPGADKGRDNPVIAKKSDPDKTKPPIKKKSKTPNSDNPAVKVDDNLVVPQPPDNEPEKTPENDPFVTPPTSADNRVDLLTKIDPARDAVSGEWRMDEGRLVSPPRSGDAAPALVIGHRVPDEYELEIIAERDARVPAGKDEYLRLGLWRGQTQFAIDIDGPAGSGIVTPEKPAYGQMPDLPRPLLARGIRKRIVFRLSNRNFDVRLDGKQIIFWAGPNDLIAPADSVVKLDDREKIRLETGGSYLIWKMEVRPLTPDWPASAVAGGPGTSNDSPGGEGTKTGPTVAAQQPVIDLLKEIKPERDATGLECELDDGALTVFSTTSGKVQIPRNLPDEYSVTMVLEKHADKALNNVTLGLPIAGHRATLWLDGLQGEGNYRTNLMLNSSYENSTTRKGQNLTEERPNRVVIQVRKQAIQVDCNNETLIEWTGDPKAQGPALKEGEHYLTLGGWDNPYKVTKLEIRDLAPGGEAVAIGPAIGDGAPLAPKAKPVVKQDVPDAAQQAEWRKKIKEAFDVDFSTASSATDKFDLARKLLDEREAFRDDPAGRYVALSEAADLAAEGASPELLMQVIDELAENFKVDDLELRTEGLIRAAKGFRSPEDHKQLFKPANDVIEAATQEDRFGEVGKLTKLCQSSVRMTKDADLQKEVAATVKRVRDLEVAYDKTKSARTKLEESPDDPEANNLWGKYLCLSKGDWDRGLTHLAKGSTAALKVAAEKDAANPTDAAEQVRVGDLWSRAADAATANDKTVLMVRADYWYRQGIKDLKNGLDKTRVDQRMREVAKLDKGIIPQKGRKLSGTPGMVGRMVNNNTDLGILMRYVPGSTIRNWMTYYLTRNQSYSGRFLLEFDGVLHVPKATTVIVRHSGGSDEGTCTLNLNGKTLGEVGDENLRDTTYTVSLQPGEHEVKWSLRGYNFGRCALSFIDQKSGQPLQVYVTNKMLEDARSKETTREVDASARF